MRATDNSLSSAEFMMSMDMSNGGMDHGSMDHSGMQHGSSMCKMNMIFHWDPTDVCVVFEWWHIRGPGTLAASLIGIILLGIGYEYLRTLTSAPVIVSPDIDSRDCASSPSPTLIDVEMPPPIAIPSDTTKYGTLFNVRKSNFLKRYQMRLRSVLYAIQVLYSFFIMLIAMTYNGWIIIAVGVGALIGHLFFGYRTQSRTMSCH
ncbi:Ctr copper transporter family-domain-containing protein [Lipomyces kononenkoae]